MDKALIVLDVGKTHTKLSLLDGRGAILATRTRTNARRSIEGRAVLDADGIEAWLMPNLSEFAHLAAVGAIVPVGHGAAAALIANDRLATPILDYEFEPPAEIARRYESERDPFGETFSPRLPQGLNLGLQLFWQEALYPGIWPAHARALPWPQYWAWRLSGEHASEVTSFGCHSDLWQPSARSFSNLALRRGWARQMEPLRAANAPLGLLRPDIADATGLPRSCEILCGIHDSNAALNTARGIAALRGGPFVLVSTGTWFVAMQSGAGKIPQLDARHDTLMNVDWEGRPVPSARFMGGREYESIMGDAIGTLPRPDDAKKIISRGIATRPSFVPGCGPFPDSRAAVIGAPEDDSERAALASLHLALMTLASLDLISAAGPIVIEGRFAADPVFPAALAALRPGQPVYRTELADGVALGAARLKYADLAPQGPMEEIEPLDVDLRQYWRQWNEGALNG